MVDQVDEVKGKVDIIEVISSYLPLKGAGRNFAGLCPFHSEKTPSFMVSPDRQVFKCFGCGEGGDVFTFLEKVEGWDFKETLEELAKRVGVKLESFAPTARSQTREKLISINKLASQFYSHLLNNHKLGEKARKYLLSRGIKEPLWQKFGLGYSPLGWENILSFLQKRKFLIEDIATSGLVVASDSHRGSFYDRFRDRLIFPLRDARGITLGFSARIIEPSFAKATEGKSETREEPKYINSPETPIFNKGSILFGLDVAREQARKKNEVLLVEGEFDVLSAYGAGVENVVASKGTALTDKQVAMIARFCENVALCFDRDLAGDAASRRGIELLDLADVNVKVVKLAKFKDADEYAQKDPQGFKGAIAGAVNIYDYFIESATQRYDAQSALGKKKIGQEVLPIIAKISDDLVRAHFAQKLAKILDLDVQAVASALEKKVVNLYPASADAISTTRSQPSKLEVYFLALFIFQEEIGHDFFKLISKDDFETDEAQQFWSFLHDIMRNSKKASLKRILAKLPKNLASFVDELYLINISPAFGDKEMLAQELVKIAKNIKHASFKRKLTDISKSLKQAQEREDKEQVNMLTRRFDEVSKNLREASI